MDPLLLDVATAAWAIVSALAVVGLGAVAFGGGASRPPGTVPFGAFAILWGLHVVAGQWMTFVPAELAAPAHLLYLTFLIPLPYLLVELAAAYTESAGSTTRWRAARIAAGAVSTTAAVLVLAAPDLLYAGSFVAPEGVYPTWGPLYAPLAIAPFFAALTVALFAFDHARRRAPTGRLALRHGLLAGGLGIFTSFSVANNLAYFGVLLTDPTYPPETGYVTLFGGLTLVVLAIGVGAAIQAFRASSSGLSRPAALVAAATLGPLAWGIVEGVVASSWLPRLNTVGLWRLVGVAMLAYGLARWRSPELSERTRRGAATAAGVVGAALSGGVSAGALILIIPSTPAALVAAVAVPVVAVGPSVRMAHRLLRTAARRGDERADLARRLDTYRAALESSLARSALEDDASFLEALRERLRISPDVHEALLCIAQATVLAPADASHPGFERLRLLGEGAQGRAWLARRRVDDELVVLKEPRSADPPSAKALLRQARLVSGIHHENLLRIHEVVEFPRGPVLVTEFVPGGSAADRLAQGPMEPELAAHLVDQVLAALSVLHARGIVHGDVKASNVLLDDDGNAKLADLGLAQPWSVDATRTRVGAEGTLSAMAPEQLDGGTTTPAADIYAAGALLYRLLTGENYLDFAGLDETSARDLVRASPPRLPHPRVPAALEPVVRRGLAKDPRERYATAVAMREALAAITPEARAS